MLNHIAQQQVIKVQYLAVYQNQVDLDEFCFSPNRFCSLPTEKTIMPMRELSHAAWVNSHID